MRAFGSFPPLRTWAPLTLLLAAFGCATGSTHVVQAPSVKTLAASARLVEDSSGVPVPGGVRDQFRAALASQLYRDRVFAEGPELTVKWKFVAFDEGNQALRYFVGFGAGKGSLVVQASFCDRSGKVLATILSQGDISMGAFGGTFDTAVQGCAREIAMYAAANFR